MSIERLHHTLSNLCVSGILRCLKSKMTTGVHVSYVRIADSLNLEMLRFYWAISKGVEELAQFVVHQPRRLTTAITYEEFERVGEITGSINAGATLLAQARTLNPTLFVVLEPNTTVHSEPNHLVAWTLSEALHILLSSRRLYKILNDYDWFNSKMTLLEQALRHNMLQDIMLTHAGRKRPTGSAIRAASKSRIPVYQKAIETFDLLEGIEGGREEAITTCLSQTLVAELEHWQQLELATAIEASYALSTSCNIPVTLQFPIVTGRPVATVGQFEVYWQYTIPHRSREQLDITELWSRQIASGIGVKPSDSRADVVVCYNGNIVSIFECKYFESISSLPQAILDASSQIVRYSRDVNPDSVPQAKALLNTNCIVVAERGSLEEKLEPQAPLALPFDQRFIYFTDVDGLGEHSLAQWASQLLATLATSSLISAT